MGLLGPLLLALFQHPVEDSEVCGRQGRRSCVLPVLPRAPVSLVLDQWSGPCQGAETGGGSVCGAGVLLLGSIMPSDHYAGLGQEVGVWVTEPKCWLHSCRPPLGRLFKDFNSRRDGLKAYLTPAIR